MDCVLNGTLCLLISEDAEPLREAIDIVCGKCRKLIQKSGECKKESHQEII